MPFAVHISWWDAVLLVVVSAQAMTIAYLHHPKWKLLAMSLPMPFTFGSLALGLDVNATHVTGLAMFILFTHAVRSLHYGLRLPIVAAIVICGSVHLLISASLARVIPATDGAFWLACGCTMALAGVLYLTMPHRPEPGHRSTLPVWVKLPVVAGVICGLILAKQILSGFMAMFPMIGVVTAYEARRSLWAMSRQAHALALAFVPMMVAVRLLQTDMGLGLALLAGWGVFLPLCLLSSWWMWSAAGRSEAMSVECAVENRGGKE